MTEEQEVELRRLEEAVNNSEGDGLRVRWAFGRYMLTLRGEKSSSRRA